MLYRSMPMPIYKRDVTNWRKPGDSLAANCTRSRVLTVYA